MGRMPPQSDDFSILDADFLDGLARRWEPSHAIAEWRSHVERTGDIQVPSEPPASVSAAGRKSGAKA